MTHYPNSIASTDGYLFIIGKVWRSFQAKRQARAERRKLGAALCDLNTAQLRDVGYIRE